ncbi:Alpha-2A Adrenergic Receptor [Manis pentadactyla]|nr:Alpha-2A Adrenergic Receptor [Manis pentadactyla]
MRSATDRQLRRRPPVSFGTNSKENLQLETLAAHVGVEGVQPAAGGHLEQLGQLSSQTNDSSFNFSASPRGERWLPLGTPVITVITALAPASHMSLSLTFTGNSLTSIALKDVIAPSDSSS